ncbi:hypothetical protein D3C76_1538950 [compost metagenome]
MAASPEAAIVPPVSTTADAVIADWLSPTSPPTAASAAVLLTVLPSFAARVKPVTVPVFCPMIPPV